MTDSSLSVRLTELCQGHVDVDQVQTRTESKQERETDHRSFLIWAASLQVFLSLNPLVNNSYPKTFIYLLWNGEALPLETYNARPSLFVEVSDGN